MDSKSLSVEDLLDEWTKLKEVENQAKERRREVGRKIASTLGHPADSQQTHNVGKWKVTVKGVVNWKVDWSEFDRVTHENPAKPPPFKIKRELDLVGLQWIRKNDPDYYGQLASRALTSKPGLPQIKITPGDL